MPYPDRQTSIVSGATIDYQDVKDIYIVLGTNPKGNTGAADLTVRLATYDTTLAGLSGTYLKGTSVSATPPNFVKVNYNGTNNSIQISANPTHGVLLGLSADDHPQYLNQARAASGFLQIPNLLSEYVPAASAAQVRTNLGISNVSTLTTGTSGPTLVLANDPRFATYMVKTSNLADVASIPAARITLQLSSGATTAVAATPASAGAGEIVLGADARLNDSRPPCSHTHLAPSGISNWQASLSSTLAVSGGSIATSGTQVVIQPGATNVGSIDHNSLNNLAVGNVHTQYALKANNLSDITASAARTNLGLGTVAVLPSAAVPTSAGIGEVVLGADTRLTGALRITNLLSEISASPSATAARNNLGFPPLSTMVTNSSPLLTGSLQISNMLSEISAGPSAAQARTNLHLSAGATAAFGTTVGTILDGSNATAITSAQTTASNSLNVATSANTTAGNAQSTANAALNDALLVSSQLVSTSGALTSNLNAHISAAASAHPGTAIYFVPGGSGLVSDDTTDAIIELAGILSTNQAQNDSALVSANKRIDDLQKQVDQLVGTPTPPPPNPATTVTMVGFTPAQLDKIVAARAASTPTAEQTMIKNLYAQMSGGTSGTPGSKSHPTSTDSTFFPAFVDSSNGMSTTSLNYDGNAPNYAVRCLAQAIRYYVEGDTICRDNVISETAVTGGGGGTGWMSAANGFMNTKVFYTSNVGGHSSYTNAKLDPAWIMPCLAAACSIVAYKDDLDHPDPSASPPVWTETRRQATRDWFWNTGFAVTPSGAPTTNPPATGAAQMNHTNANNWIASMFHARVNIAGWLLSGNAASQSNGQAILTNAINWYRDMITWLFYIGVDAGSSKNAQPPYPLFMNENDLANNTQLEKAQMWWFGDARVGDTGLSGTVAAGSPYAANFFEGLVQEHGRDISHAMMSVGSLGCGAATVYNLGTDLYDDTTNDNGRRLRIATEITAGYINEALDQFWSTGGLSGPYTAGIDSSSSNALSGSTWTPNGGVTYGGTPNWVNTNMGTVTATPAGGGGSQRASSFSMGGNAYLNGWGATAYYLINVKGYYMPQLDRLRRRIIGTGSTGSSNTLAGLDGTQSLNAQDPSMSFHNNMSLDTYTWYFQPHTVLAHDNFTRSVPSGSWGATDTTNQSGDSLTSYTWVMSDDSAHPTKFSVDSTTGRARISISNGTAAGQTVPVNATDIDVYCRFDLDKIPAVGSAIPSLHLQGRRTGTTWYSAAARINPPTTAGQPATLGLRLYYNTGTTLTQLPNMGVTANFTYAVGQGLWIRLYIKGSTIQMKGWVSALDTPANEPIAWSLSTGDTQITTAGSIGIYEGMGTGNDPGFPILMSADHFHVKAPV